MSNLANAASLHQNKPQLPASWYADQRIYDIEQKVLFANSPTYVGAEAMVPNVGDYYVLDWMHKAKVLVHNENGVELLDNVCRHRQSLLLQGKGNTKNIVCPVHKWTYAMGGELLGAPHFNQKPCLALGKTPLQTWNGLYFTQERDFAKDMARLRVNDLFDWRGYVLDSVVVEEYNYNWKAFIEIYLDDYHVEFIHPGLSRYVSTDSLKWEFGERYSLQMVTVNDMLKRSAGTPAYQRWHDKLKEYNQGKIPPFGAMWLLYYPNITLEWYPHTLVVSTVLSRGPNHCTNVVEFYYTEEIAMFEREFVLAEQAAFDETAKEDEAICQMLHNGRKALYDIGVNDAMGPYQTPTEDGIQVFHEWIRRELDPHV